jgi:hypothetical protein
VAGEATQRSWFERNWKWFVPALLAFGMACLAGFIYLIFYFVMSMMQSSEPYQHALAEAKRSPAVTAAIGEPIREGWFITGKISEGGGSGSASLAIPVSGPRGGATIYVEARESAGQWQYQQVVVELDSSHERIELQ